MRTRRREHERDRRARAEADREDRRTVERTVADPPRTVDDLLETLDEGDGLTYEEAALVGGIEESVAGFDGEATDARTHGGW